MIGARQFGGMYPRLSARLLPEDGALLARNCWLDRGSPRPIPVLQQESGVGTFPASTQTIYRYDGEPGSYRFFRWRQDVDVVRSPVFNDTLNRVIWSGEQKAGEQTPDDARVRHTNTRVMQGQSFTSPGLPFSRELGVPAPDRAITWTLGDFTDQDTEEVALNDVWVYTWVTDLQEEGPPSPASAIATRGFNTDGTIRPAILSIPQNAPSGRGINRYRIYRSTGESFEQVYQGNLVSSAVNPQTYTDQLTEDQLGSALITENWDPPPAGLLGLTVLHNGILAGFKGRDIYFSVPYQPHAWPQDYIVTLDSDIVGIGGYGVNVIVGTVGKPYIISGDDPATSTVQQLELDQPCVSKRSFAWIDRMGVVYASPDGLVLVGPNGGEFISRTFYDREDWNQLDIRDMRGIYHDGKYVAFFPNQTIALSPQQAPIEFDDTGLRGAYLDREEDKIWVLNADNDLHEWETDDVQGTNREMIWRSRLYVMPGMSVNAAQVFAEGPVTLWLYYANEEIEDYSTATNIWKKDLTANEINRPIRIPALGIWSHWVYEIKGQNTVSEVRIGTMAEMVG